MDIAKEFARIVSCEACTTRTSSNLLRDSGENVPQPGFIGRNYRPKGLVLVGRNPAVCKPEHREQDAAYTDVLRRLKRKPTPELKEELTVLLEDYMPKWWIIKKFPFDECEVGLDDIAFFNVVRCRMTKDKHHPAQGVINNCRPHFERWLDLLEPGLLIFLGKWGYDRADDFVNPKKTQTSFINCSSKELIKDQEKVVKLVHQILNK
ncbi:MAG: hypothetical protein HY788_12365 [Deltaproteobacteria bacterium]|nr:hypothetical protein [Deltaproteobacteria bacterium]